MWSNESRSPARKIWRDRENSWPLSREFEGIGFHMTGDGIAHCLCILLPIRMPTARCRGPLATPSTVTTMPAEVADARKTMSLRPPPKPEAPPREGVPLPARPPPRPRVSPPRRTHPSSRFHRTTTASPGANPRAALCGGGGKSGGCGESAADSIRRWRRSLRLHQ